MLKKSRLSYNDATLAYKNYGKIMQIPHVNSIADYKKVGCLCILIK